MALRYPRAGDETYRYSLHLGQLLRSALGGRSGNEIVGSDGRRHSYAEFGRRVHRLAHVLKSLGVDSGDVVAVMDWDSHRYLECYFAIPMLGAILQTVNVRLSPDQITYTLEDTQAKTLLFHSDFVPIVEQLTQRIPTLQNFVSLHDGAAIETRTAVAGEYESLLDAADAEFPFEEIDENALATMFHTTGTTGHPKAVAFTHRQLVLHTLSFGMALGTQPPEIGLDRSDVYMPMTPMFHVHAWGVPYVATLLGLKQVYPGKYEPARLLALRRAERVTFSHCVPTILQMLLDAFRPEDAIGDWRLIVGGSIVPRALLRAASEKGIRVFTGYGMSETCPVLTLARSWMPEGEAREGELCSAGHAIPLVQLRVVDESLQAVAADGTTQGELVARAPWLTASYANDASATRGLWRGGWLHTQDVATESGNGRIVIRDRLKDVIKSGGEWISSCEMEDLAMRHAGVAMASFIGVADARWGERPVAFVVARENSNVDLVALRTHLQAHVDSGEISRFALPDEVIQIEALPRTSVGKIDKKRLREIFAQRRATPV
jgi:fatty-acyl-CoA synthase